MKHCFMGVQSLDKGVIGRGTWRIRGWGNYQATPYYNGLDYCIAA